MNPIARLASAFSATNATEGDPAAEPDEGTPDGGSQSPVADGGVQGRDATTDFDVVEPGATDRVGGTLSDLTILGALDFVPMPVFALPLSPDGDAGDEGADNHGTGRRAVQALDRKEMRRCQSKPFRKTSRPWWTG